MALTNFGITRRASAVSAVDAVWPRRVALAILPFVLILAWTAAVRLPFYGTANGDEFFFSTVASEWLRGGVPYVDTFDIKPPGVFFIYAVAQALFGASYATFKGLEIIAVAAGASSLYVMLRPFGAGRLAVWCAALFPVYTLAFDGTAAVNMLLQLPFIVAGFAAVVMATAEDITARQRLTGAFLAGLAIGAAGMMKQTGVFEAAAAFVVLGLYGVKRLRLKMLALFVVGAALPAVAFSAYFLAVGHFGEMFNAVIVLALGRLDSEVVASYGPKLARYLTLPGALENSLLRSAAVIFLWGGAIFALLRHALIRQVVPGRVLVTAIVWLGFSFVGVVFGRLLVDYYLLAIVPPLLILSGAFFSYGLRLASERQHLVFWLSLVVGTATLAYTDHRALFGHEPLSYDGDLVARTAESIRDLGLTENDRLLVLNRGLALHVATGARPPTAYFHGTHLMSPFRTPVDNPLSVSLAANPRFIVLADPTNRLVAELPERYQQALDYLAAHYRVAAVQQGRDDAFTVYEFVR